MHIDFKNILTFDRVLRLRWFHNLSLSKYGQRALLWLLFSDILWQKAEQIFKKIKKTHTSNEMP